MSVLKRLRELHQAATPGPLWVEPNEHEIRAPNGRKAITTAIAPHKGGNRAFADMLLYVNAVNNLGAILDALEAANALSAAVGSSAMQCYDDSNPRHYDECGCADHVMARAMDTFNESLERLGGEKETGR